MDDEDDDGSESGDANEAVTTSPDGGAESVRLGSIGNERDTEAMR